MFSQVDCDVSAFSLLSALIGDTNLNMAAERIFYRHSQIRLPGVKMLGSYDHSSAKPGLLAHQHKGAMEICLLTRGEQSYAVNGREFRLRGGDQFVTFAGEMHDSAGRPQEKGRLYWLIVDLSAAALLRMAPTDVKRLRAALQQLPCRHFPAHPEAAMLFREIISEMGQKHDLRSIRVASLILRYLLRTIEAAQTEAKSYRTLRWNDCQKYIQDHLDENLAVADLAAVCQISAPRFKAWFRQVSGVPPKEFVLRRKIDAAAHQLAHTNKSVTDIAFRLGFNSSQYFATVFRRFMQCAPLEYRKRPCAAVVCGEQE